MRIWSGFRTTMYLAEGAIVRDAFRERSDGRVTAIRGDGAWVDVVWPSGIHSTYTREAAVESLEVQQPPLMDLFGLGVHL